MKIWAIDRSGSYEHEIGIECEDTDRETAINALYRIARNLFPENLNCSGKRGKRQGDVLAVALELAFDCSI